MRKNSLILSIVALAILAIPALALADVEIYTYGGFNVVSGAYKRIALITASGSFRSIFTGMAALGLVTAGILGLRQVAAGRTNMLLAFLPPVVGCALFLSVMLPKETVYIYDPVLNGVEAIGGVPIGVSKPAAFANLIERAIIDILDNNPATIGEPLYQNVGVRAYDLAAQLGTASLGDENWTATLQSYLKACVVFELSREGGSLSQDMLFRPPAGQTLLDVLAQAKNDAIFAPAYLDPDHLGEAITCAAMYEQIKTRGDALSGPALTAILSSQGLPDTAAAQSIMSAVLDPITMSAGITADPARIIQMQAVANITTAALSSSADSATLFAAEAAQAKAGITGGVAASIVNPRMIDAYMSYAICIIPILFLFAATPLMSKIISYSLSLIIWIALARVVDVIAYHTWVAEYMSAAAGFSGGGLDFSFDYTSFFGSHLGALADLRSSAFLLASAISAALFKFSDSALAHLASRASATAAGQAADALDPGKAAQKIQEIHGGVEREKAVQALAAGGGIANMAKGQIANEVAGAMGGAGKLNAADGNYNNLASKEQMAGGVGAKSSWGQAQGKLDAAGGKLDTVETNEQTVAGVGTSAAVGGAKGKQKAAGGTLEAVQDKEQQKAVIGDSKAYGDADQQTPDQAYATGAAHAGAAVVGKTANGTATRTEQNIASGQAVTEVAGAKLTHQGEKTVALAGAPAGADLSGRLAAQSSQARREANSEISAEVDRASKTVSADERRGKTLDNIVSSNQSFRNDKAASDVLLLAKQQGRSSATTNSDNYSEQQSVNKTTGANAGGGAGTGSTPGASANVGANVGINTSNSKTGSSTTGTNSAVSESENTIKNLQRMATSTGSDGVSREQREAAQRALSYVTAETTGHDLSQNFSKLNEASRSEQQSQELASAFRADSGLAFYKHLARETYGDDSASNVTNAIADTAQLVQSEEGLKQLQGQLQGFAETLAPESAKTISEPSKTVDHDTTAQKIAAQEADINNKGEALAVPLAQPKTSLAPVVTGPAKTDEQAAAEFETVKKGNADSTKLMKEAKADLPTNAAEALMKTVLPGAFTTNAATVDGLRNGKLNRDEGFATGTPNDYTPSNDSKKPEGTAANVVQGATDAAPGVIAGLAKAVPAIVSGVAGAIPKIVNGLGGLNSSTVAKGNSVAPAPAPEPVQVAKQTDPSVSVQPQPVPVKKDNQAAGVAAPEVISQPAGPAVQPQPILKNQPQPQQQAAANPEAPKPEAKPEAPAKPQDQAQQTAAPVQNDNQAPAPAGQPQPQQQAAANPEAPKSEVKPEAPAKPQDQAQQTAAPVQNDSLTPAPAGQPQPQPQQQAAAITPAAATRRPPQQQQAPAPTLIPQVIPGGPRPGRSVQQHQQTARAKTATPAPAPTPKPR